MISVRVQPRAKQERFAGIKDGQLLVRTTAAPVDGKANKAVTGMLAKSLGVAPSRITLLRGQTHKNKQFLIRGPL